MKRRTFLKQLLAAVTSPLLLAACARTTEPVAASSESIPDGQPLPALRS